MYCICTVHELVWCAEWPAATASPPPFAATLFLPHAVGPGLQLCRISSRAVHPPTHPPTIDWLEEVN